MYLNSRKSRGCHWILLEVTWILQARIRMGMTNILQNHHRHLSVHSSRPCKRILFLQRHAVTCSPKWASTSTLHQLLILHRHYHALPMRAISVRPGPPSKVLWCISYPCVALEGKHSCHVKYQGLGSPGADCRYVILLLVITDDNALSSVGI